MSHNEARVTNAPAFSTVLEALKDMLEMMREDMEERRAHRKRMSSRYTNHKPISNIQFSMKNNSLCDEAQPVGVEGCINENETLSGLVSTNACEFSEKLDCMDLFACNPSTIVTPTSNDVHVDVCELGKKGTKGQNKSI